MSIYLRGTTWWVYFRHGNQDVRQSTGTKDKKAAQEYHDRLKAELWRTEALGERPPVRWEEAWTDWWNSHAQFKKSASDDHDKLRWLTQRLAGKALKDITPEVVELLRKEKLADGVSRATVNRYLAVLSSVLRHAHAKGWTLGAPKIIKFAEPKIRIRWITKDEAKILLQELPPHLRAMARFSLATGLRRANVTGLKWTDVDLKRKVAWVHGDESKSGRAIGVPLNDSAVSVLEGQVGIHPIYVFTYKGKPVESTGKAAWFKACTRAGLTDFHWHDLRHTWASWHVQAGTSLSVLQELGGWASLAMVMKYAHLAPDHLAQAAKVVDLACEDSVRTQPVRRGKNRQKPDITAQSNVAK